MKLQDEMRDLKSQLNEGEASIEHAIKAKEKVSQQFKEQQNHNADLSKRIEALNSELENRDEMIAEIKLKAADVEAEKKHVLSQLAEATGALASVESGDQK